MKFLVSADMEGATGVTWSDDCEPGTEAWQRCRGMFTSDVNAAVEGLFDGGAHEVLVNEAHATMRNLLLERLDPRAEMITGRHKSLTMVEGVQTGDVDGVVFLGYHAAAGEEGVLAHTYLPNSITRVWFDDQIGSEGALNAAVVAEFGTPVVLLTGDDKACADARRWAPDHAQTVAVKDHVSRYAARCRPPERTAADIRAGAQRAAASAGRIQPQEPSPHTVEIEVDAAQLADFAALVPTVSRTAPRRVAYTAESAVQAIRTFKAVTTLISSGVEGRYG
ncbi:MAG TPA: M55 family metallopeptidase [Jiangellaceae bacterium]|nr:M55 family metallopeptidase [Jiangellaceae bacterium]